jgi:hypothetical protein
MSNEKRVYTFGDRKAEGNASMKNLLGGKGANLAEMNLIGVPVPAGFTITTDVCTEYNQKGRDAVVELMKAEVEAGIAATEKAMNAKFGSTGEAFPLLLSVSAIIASTQSPVAPISKDVPGFVTPIPIFPSFTVIVFIRINEYGPGVSSMRGDISASPPTLTPNHSGFVSLSSVSMGLLAPSSTL